MMDLFADQIAEQDGSSPSRIMRLAWARAEAARQLVYRDCLRLISDTPEADRQPVAERYLSDVLSAIAAIGSR